MDDGVDRETIIKPMNQGGVYRTILAARSGIRSRAIGHHENVRLRLRLEIPS